MLEPDNNNSQVPSVPRTQQQPPELVLIADDNPVSQLLLSRYFLGIGIHTDLARDGARAVSLARKGNYSLIVMDLCMPGMDGLTATRTIRAHERYVGRPAVPILIVSASGDANLGSECEEAGATAFLPKPISFAALQTAITRWRLLSSCPGESHTENTFTPQA